MGDIWDAILEEWDELQAVHDLTAYQLFGDPTWGLLGQQYEDSDVDEIVDERGDYAWWEAGIAGAVGALRYLNPLSGDVLDRPGFDGRPGNYQGDFGLFQDPAEGTTLHNILINKNFETPYSDAFGLLDDALKGMFYFLGWLVYTAPAALVLPGISAINKRLHQIDPMLRPPLPPFTMHVNGIAPMSEVDPFAPMLSSNPDINPLGERTFSWDLVGSDLFDPFTHWGGFHGTVVNSIDPMVDI